MVPDAPGIYMRYRICHLRLLPQYRPKIIMNQGLLKSIASQDPAVYAKGCLADCCRPQTQNECRLKELNGLGNLE